MKITVKNVKISPAASEETLCFEAVVYLDGKEAFLARNEGRGGCNRYIGDRKLVEQADAYARSLPERMEQGISYQPDLDTLVDDAISRWELEKQARAILKTAAIAVDGQILTFKCASTHPDFRPHVAKSHPNATILNDLPFDEVVAVIGRPGSSVQ